jgi:hypothetical protein
MVKNRIVIMLLILLALPALASAEIYKYRDQNGILRFTDNLAEVPVEQRENMDQYQEIRTAPDVAEQAPDNASEQAVAQDAQTVEKKLMDEKGILDSEYSQLTEMRNSLEAAPQSNTPEEIAAHENKIKDYNARLKIYEARQKAFREKVEEYNKASAEN